MPEECNTFLKKEAEKNLFWPRCACVRARARAETLSAHCTCEIQFQMSPKTAVWLLAAVCVWCAEECVCFPNGSVAPSCGSMMPTHPPYKPSNSTPPVKLSVSSATYRPGGLISGEWAPSFRPARLPMMLSASSDPGGGAEQLRRVQGLPDPGSQQTGRR